MGMTNRDNTGDGKKARAAPPSVLQLKINALLKEQAQAELLRQRDAMTAENKAEQKEKQDVARRGDDYAQRSAAPGDKPAGKHGDTSRQANIYGTEVPTNSPSTANGLWRDAATAVTAPTTFSLGQVR